MTVLSYNLQVVSVGSFNSNIPFWYPGLSSGVVPCASLCDIDIFLLIFFQTRKTPVTPFFGLSVRKYAVWLRKWYQIRMIGCLLWPLSKSWILFYFVSFHLILTTAYKKDTMKQSLCINLEGWDGAGGGREVQKKENICISMADWDWGLTENSKIL